MRGPSGQFVPGAVAAPGWGREILPKFLVMRARRMQHITRRCTSLGPGRSRALGKVGLSGSRAVCPAAPQHCSCVPAPVDISGLCRTQRARAVPHCSPGQHRAPEEAQEELREGATSGEARLWPGKAAPGWIRGVSISLGFLPANRAHTVGIGEDGDATGLAGGSVAQTLLEGSRMPPCGIYCMAQGRWGPAEQGPSASSMALPVLPWFGAQRDVAAVPAPASAAPDACWICLTQAGQ